MAKSLRSKRRRKVRAEKRIVNAKKELVKLKEVSAKLHAGSLNNYEGVPITKELLESNIPDIHVTQAPMVIDGDLACDDSMGEPRISKKASARINNQWMNQRKIKAIKSKIKKYNKKKSRRGKPAGLSGRKAKKGIKK